MSSPRRAPVTRAATSAASLLIALALAATITTACGSDSGVTGELGSATEPAAPQASSFALLDEPTATPSPAADSGPVATTAAEPAPGPSPTAALPPGIVEVLEPEILDVYPHDNTAYTQGLELHDGLLIESTGRQGHPGGDQVFESDLREVEVTTGQVVRRADLPGTVFGEGLTRVGGQLVQITWQDGMAYWWDAATFELLREVRYDGDGWGLCYDGERLVMTDGGPNLFFRDPETFELIGQVPVTLSGTPLGAINELECLNGDVWANVYRTDFVVRIDPATGVVDGVVDASQLEQPRTTPTEVLNGLAWDDQSSTWLMTGKFWSNMYRVQFVRTGTTDSPLGPSG